MKKLIVGNKSQISNYFPESYLRVSSKEIPHWVFSLDYDEVHLPFGINIKGLSKKEYMDINYYKMLDVALYFSKISKKVIVYSTCELWSNCTGGIDIETPFNFIEDPYTTSKYEMTEKIKSWGRKNIKIVYPFNFNSTYRSKDFLFGKVFHSIINKEKIEIGNTYYNRDILHAKWVAKNCQKVEEDTIIGSGQMIFVNKFIRDIYKSFDLDYDEYVTENLNTYTTKMNEYFLKLNKPVYDYEQLLYDTIDDIKTFKRIKHI